MHTLRGAIHGLRHTAYLLPLKRVANTQQQSRLLHVIVLVAQDSNAARLHHQTQREGKIIAQPTLSERSGSVAVCDQDDVLGFAVMHMRCLDFADLLNQFVEARRQLCRRSSRMLATNREALTISEIIILSTLTTVSPDVPFLVLVKTTLLTQGPDVFRNATFIVTTSKHESASICISYDEAEYY